MSKSTKSDTRSFECPYPACKEIFISQSHMLVHIRYFHAKQRLDTKDITVLVDAIGASQSSSDKKTYFCPCGAGPFTVYPKSAKVHLSKLEDDETVIWHKFLAADLQGQQADHSKIDRDEFYVYQASAGASGFFVPTKTVDSLPLSGLIDLTNEWKFMTYQPSAGGDTYVETPTDNSPPNSAPAPGSGAIIRFKPTIEQYLTLLRVHALKEQTKEFEAITGGPSVTDAEMQAQEDFFWFIDNADFGRNAAGEWDADDPMNPDNMMKNLPPLDMDWEL